MQISYHAGIDYFTPLAGTQTTMRCQACKEELDVQRDILRTKGKFGNTLPADSHREEDVFTCRHAGEEWHSQIIALLKEIDRTASQKLASLLESEIVEICRTRQVTKKLTCWQI
jgi:hypothetical protein